MASSLNHPCPCGSGKKYKKCCSLYHQGKFPETPEILMRSRYSAYVLKLLSYVIKTTHASHPDTQRPLEAWMSDLSTFINDVKLMKLTILHAIVTSPTTGEVTFAIDSSLGGWKERSFFIKEGPQWFYQTGIVDES